jgi:lipopolysaccharide transport system ATP-binding protein
MSTAIRVENLSKAYSLGVINRRIFAHEWWLKLTRRKESDDHFFWALRDISLDVRDGEVVGLLGANGAGKSTLLKVISQITSPTRGCVKLRGRVGSLLEVGTGFHPDLTGRDNVFLNGAILGMSRREVTRKFDEIVAFAGIGEFIETPVKRYSVGMRVRLAFAVAAQLEPEILVIDEVLAVGDAAFQQKCLGRIGEVSRSGRTVLFVSHNSAAIAALCTRGIVLETGRITFEGSPSEAIDYYAATRGGQSTELSARTDRSGSGEVVVTTLELRNARSEPVASIRSGEDLEVALHFQRHAPGPFPRLGVQIAVTTHLGTAVFTHANWHTGDSFGDLPAQGVVVCRIPRLPLPAGRYRIGFRVSAEMRGRRDPFDAMDFAAELAVESGDFFGTGYLPKTKDGLCLVDGSWRLEP